ncbi:hypothetical protein [Hymenobacter busanensis]|uniref:hypothetical protein n=1 Tax=Hymenobacter busanensis TaxID=2607656 RepID=UPI001366957E|nr:hypothetical protein [Hymenobacter busanensis]QHJ06386.1 hypothetical protein GUY19_03355 [Hymenobacter busanensis]
MGSGGGSYRGGAWPLFLYSKHASEVAAVAHNESTAWVERHVQPVWYYWSFPVFTGVWVVAAVAALAWRFARPRLQRFLPYTQLFAWVSITLVLLTLIPEKKERYLLPVLPPLALLAGGMLRFWLLGPNHQTRLDRRLLRLWGGLFAVVGVGVPVALQVIHLPGYHAQFLMYWGCTAVFGGIAIWAVWNLVRQPQASVILACGILVTVGFTSLLMGTYPQWQRRRDDPGLRPLRTVVSQHPECQKLPVFSLNEEMHIKWIWAAQRPVPVWHVSPTEGNLLSVPLPVIVYSSHRLQRESFPASWRKNVKIAPLDSFTIGHKVSDGTWHVAKLESLDSPD